MVFTLDILHFSFDIKDYGETKAALNFTVV